MQVIEKAGLYLPSKLARELNEAGVDALGVTCSEFEGVVGAVQIICDEGANLAAIEAVCAAHNPAPDPVV